MMQSRQETMFALGEGRKIPGMGAGAFCKVAAADFDGRLFIFEGRMPPGHRIPSHTHTREDEVTVVLAGQLQIQEGGVVSTAGVGSVVRKPRGVPHSMWNASSEPATVLEIHTPGSIEPYYDALGELFTTTDVADAQRYEAINKLQDQYGITFHEAPTAPTR